MEDNFEHELKKCLDDSITALSIKVEKLLRRHCDNAPRLKVGKPLRNLYYDRESGYMKLQFKYQYTPEEIEILESIKGFSKEQIEDIKRYMEKLTKEG